MQTALIQAYCIITITKNSHIITCSIQLSEYPFLLPGKFESTRAFVDGCSRNILFSDCSWSNRGPSTACKSLPVSTHHDKLYYSFTLTSSGSVTFCQRNRTLEGRNPGIVIVNDNATAEFQSLETSLLVSIVSHNLLTYFKFNLVNQNRIVLPVVYQFTLTFIYLFFNVTSKLLV